MKIVFLPLFATMALYCSWKFASPFLPNPTLQYAKGWLRHSPFILFVLAGSLIAIALPNFGHSAFVATLVLSVSMMLAGMALAYWR